MSGSSSDRRPTVSRVHRDPARKPSLQHRRRCTRRHRWRRRPTATRTASPRTAASTRSTRSPRAPSSRILSRRHARVLSSDRVEKAERQEQAPRSRARRRARRMSITRGSVGNGEFERQQRDDRRDHRDVREQCRREACSGVDAGVPGASATSTPSTGTRWRASGSAKREVRVRRWMGGGPECVRWT